MLLTSSEKMLSLVDREKLENLIENVCDEHFQNGVNLKKHLEYWSLNKHTIFCAFGNKLRIEKEIELQNDNLSDMARSFKNSFTNGSYYRLFSKFLSLLQTDEIVQNVLKRDINFFDLKFKKGQKLSRTFKSLLPNISELRINNRTGEAVQTTICEQVEIEYSKFIQRTMIKGKLILSIHPVDYLTQSENKSGGYNSCHRINGEYRTGILAYMMDSCTIVAYVTEGDTLNKGHEFYHKHWRQLVYMSDDIDYAIQSREYPCENVNYSNAVTEVLKEIIGTEKSEYVESHDLRNYVNNKFESPCLWYNDISYYSNMKYTKLVGTYNYNDIEVGHHVFCVETGTELRKSNYLSDRNAFPSHYETNDNDFDDDDFYMEDEN